MITQNIIDPDKFVENKRKSSFLKHIKGPFSRLPDPPFCRNSHSNCPCGCPNSGRFGHSLVLKVHHKRSHSSVKSIPHYFSVDFNNPLQLSLLKLNWFFECPCVLPTNYCVCFNLIKESKTKTIFNTLSVKFNKPREKKRGTCVVSDCFDLTSYDRLDQWYCTGITVFLKHDLYNNELHERELAHDYNRYNVAFRLVGIEGVYIKELTKTGNSLVPLVIAHL